MGLSPRCYIPSFVDIGPPVLAKKIFDKFLPFMGLAAILVTWHRCREQILVSSAYRSFTQNLVLIAQAVMEKQLLEIVDGG